MLLDGTKQAIKHASLRTQLQNALTALGSSPSPTFTVQPNSRSALRFSSSYKPFQHQDAEDNGLVEHPASDGRRNRRIRPGGRVFGRPGRRQRELSHTLRIASMGKTSNVIVFRDVKDKPRQVIAEEDQEEAGVERIQPQTLSSKDIEADVLQTAKDSSPAEVIRSIDLLRPSESFLDEEEFNKLIEQLANGYNYKQMKRYLRRTMSTVHAQHITNQDAATAKISAWNPGRVSLMQRLPAQSKPDMRNKKTSLAEQILRRSWSVSIYSQEQEAGEQEIKVSKSQLDLLFRSTQSQGQNVPQWHTLLSSPLLIRSVELVPVEKAGVVRIIGRRQDTGQAAYEVCSGIARIATIHLGLNRLKRQSTRQDLVSSSELRLEASTLDKIQQISSTSLTQKQGGISISAFSSDSCQYAVHLFNDLLGIKAVATESSIVKCMRKGKQKFTPTLIPVYCDGLSTQTVRPLQYRRLAMPTSKAGIDRSTKHAGELTAMVLDAVRSPIRHADDTILKQHPQHPVSPEQVNWTIDHWQAQIGILAHDHALPLDNAGRTALIHQAPLTSKILELFKPYAPRQNTLPDDQSTPEVTSKKFTIAHLVSLDTVSETPLPNLELHFVREQRPSPTSLVNYQLRFHCLTAKLARHQVQIQLPEQCADFQLQQDAVLSTTSLVPGENDQIGSSRSLYEYVEQCKMRTVSARMESLRSLTPNRPLLVSFPSWLLPQGSPEHERLQSCSYSLSHFESREEINFEPLTHRLGGWNAETYLSIVESDAGLFGGRQRNVSIKATIPTGKSLLHDLQGSRMESQQLSQAEKLTQSALSLIDVLTTGIP